MERKLSILLIEDDTIEIMKVNRTISSLGLAHQIVEARNGEGALKIAEKLGIPERTCNEYLKNLAIKGFLKHGDKAGEYEKIAIA